MVAGNKESTEPRIHL